uniref:Uncharacterized protein n=1 Tax=Phlebotomus papatasi TaxID=29031 RepID=A0A1B0GN61_PHLPP
DQELTPDDQLPIGRNILELTNIQHSANYTCIAASTLGIIDAPAIVKVHGSNKKRKRKRLILLVNKHSKVESKARDDANNSVSFSASFFLFIYFWFLYKALPTAPTDVSISEVTATSVRLEWSYKGPEDLQYYVIQYKPKNANQAFSEISGIITMFYVIRGLSPYTEYEFYVIGVNNIGRGPPSIPATCTTGET